MDCKVVNLETRVECGGCTGGWDSMGVIENDEAIICPMCKRTYRRIGGACRFETQDAHRIFVPEATMAATL